MLSREQVLSLIRVKGPVIPSNIAKELGQNLIMASAVLSELVSSGALRISALKIGGSPLYYLPEHEARLQGFAKHLNDKEKRAFDRLQFQKVLVDSEQEPVIRVALRAIADFAKPLTVTVGTDKTLVWKWYLTSGDEASVLIRQKLGMPAERKDEAPASKPPEAPMAEAKPEPVVRKQEPLRKPDTRPLPRKSPVKKDVKKTIHEKPELKSAFLDEVLAFFRRKGILVLEQSIIKPSSEVDFVVSIPTQVGNLCYYCKAKFKRRIADSDLSSDFVQAQLKRLPALFVAKGDMTKKAAEMLEKDFKGISFARM